MAAASRWGSVGILLLLSTVVRVAFLWYGHWHDENMPVKYTDIDYLVFTDAARHVTEGGSPFDRPTYRYTPLLSFLLVPNVLFHPLWGKVVFISCDLLLGILLVVILWLRARTTHHLALYASIWLLNPLTVNISTRGSAETVVGVLVVATLLLLIIRRVALAGFLYGLAVHFKVYPVIYSLPILLFLDHHYNGHKAPSTLLARLMNRDRVVFFVVCGCTLATLTILFYSIYGDAFLQEAYFYHITRVDNRHNFSVFFLLLYLTHHLPAKSVLSLLAFFPQGLLLIGLGIRYARDLPFCVFIQTLAFVTFNKVVTAQYFVWFLSLVPLILPSTRMSWQQGAHVCVVWLTCEIHWLTWAYALEMEGYATFLGVWLAGILFFASNVYALVTVIRHHLFRPVFVNGTLQ